MPSDVPYKKTADSQPGQVKEHDIESEFLQKLDGLKYTLRPDIRDRASMEQNFRDKFEALNRCKLTDAEFARLLDEIVTPDVFTAAKTLREINSFTRDDGTPFDTDDDFVLPRGAQAKPGPAFASRALPGAPWGKSGLELDVLVNPEDITRMIVFDTWTLNCDRYHHDLNVRKPNPDNVFLSTEGVDLGKRRLIAMDHGLCFIRSGEELTTKLAHIEKVKDDHVYGLFPEFRERLRQHTIEECCARLTEMNDQIADAIVSTVPREWDVSSEVRRTWSELIHRRAHFVADNVETWIEKAVPWFGAERE